VTGASLGTGLALGVVLLLTGVAAVLFARRRKLPA
jgi:LPXTG-motif cell wall-anchored protein